MLDFDDDLEWEKHPEHSRRTRPFMVDTRILRFLTYEVLQLAHDSMECAVQEPGEENGYFSNLLSETARLYRVVIPKSDL